MATGIGKLTDLTCKNAAPGKHFDGGGFFLNVTETGRYWRLKYRFARREKLLALGVYPEVSLAKARSRRDEVRKRLLDGFDPGAERQSKKLRAQIAADNTFEAVARERLEVKAYQWTELQLEKEQGRLKNHAFPWPGRLPIADLGVPEIRPLLFRIVKCGHLEQAHRLRHQLSRIFRYAVATERAAREAAADLRDTLPTRRKKNYSITIDPKQVGDLRGPSTPTAASSKFCVPSSWLSSGFAAPEKFGWRNGRTSIWKANTLHTPSRRKTRSCARRRKRIPPRCLTSCPCPAKH